jgi:hypothetical protein
MWVGRDGRPRYMLYPPFAWYRVIFLLEDACIDYSCFQLDALFGVRDT